MPCNTETQPATERSTGVDNHTQPDLSNGKPYLGCCQPLRWCVLCVHPGDNINAHYPLQRHLAPFNPNHLTLLQAKPRPPDTVTSQAQAPVGLTLRTPSHPAATHIHSLLPEPDQLRAQLLGWVAGTPKHPDPVECLVQVLLVTIPVNTNRCGTETPAAGELLLQTTS
jgi:hypothetical protein